MVLALIFLISVSVVVAALLTWSGTSLTATGAFATERSTEMAATSAVNLAIQNTRYPTNTSAWKSLWSSMENASPPVACWPGGSQYVPPTGKQSVVVWCSMQWQPFTAQTRTITYSACVFATGTAAPGATACAKQPTLQAIEIFDDYAPGVATPPPNPVPCYLTTFCGQTMTQASWQWYPMLPSVTSITPTTSQIDGNAAGTNPPVPVSIGITGTNFVTGSTVSFVQESANVPTNSGQTTTSQPTQGVLGPYPATASGCNAGGTSCTQLSLNAPAVNSGTDYFVTVTTPGGTSAYVFTSGGVNYDDLQYTATTPKVTSISGLTESGLPCGSCPGGAITGGSSLTINGTGFYSTTNFPLIVLFCSSSPCTTSGSNPTGASATILSSTATSISVVSPPVSSPGTYFVQVKTLGGQSTNTSDQFGYVVQVPIIIGVTDSGCSAAPCSGGHGIPVSITGANFVPGSTVTWYVVDGNGNPTGNGTPSPGIPTVNPAGNTITTTVPTLPNKNTSYFPVVTLPSAYGSLASQTYNEPSDIFQYTS